MFSFLETWKAKIVWEIIIIKNITRKIFNTEFWLYNLGWWLQVCNILFIFDVCSVPCIAAMQSTSNLSNCLFIDEITFSVFPLLLSFCYIIETQTRCELFKYWQIKGVNWSVIWKGCNISTKQFITYTYHSCSYNCKIALLIISMY